jgi:aspartate/methionine/tyrosine aminotransferase
MPPMAELSRTASAVRPGGFDALEARIAQRLRDGGDFVRLHLGDTHLAPPEDARVADLETFNAALCRYGATSGLDVLREAFVARTTAAKVGPTDIDPGREVLVGAGGTHAIFCALRAVLDPGDEVLVVAPFWPLAIGIVRAAGGVPIEVPLTPRLYADPSLDAGAILDEARTPRTRAIYLITPNNPDGKILSAAQLASIARLAVEHDLWVLADEVYADHVYVGEHTSIARCEGMRSRTLSAYSVSKSHGLPGVRIGFVVAPEPVVQVARRISTHTVFNVSVASQRVALAALRSPPSWIESSQREYREARDAALAALAGSGAQWFAPDGGCYVFLDFAPVLNQRPLRLLLERAIDRGVLLAAGAGFGNAFTTWARLCFTAEPRARLLEGIARLREALSDLGG